MLVEYRNRQWCKQMRCTYQELQDLPEDIYDLWVAFEAGEARAADEVGMTKSTLTKR